MNKDMNYNVVVKEMISNFLNIDIYERIEKRLHTMDISVENNDFQTEFNAFYNIRRDSDWRDNYYKFFEKNKGNKDISFKHILESISLGNNVESSFASKMLATINPEKPIIDKNVLNYFDFKIEGSSKKERMESAVKVYKDIEDEYKKLLSDKEVDNTINDLKTLIGNKEISNVKILDYIIWCKGKKKKL